MKRIYYLFFILFTIIVNAQWTSDYSTNTLVSDAGSSVSQSVTTSDGKTYVVFFQPKPSPVYYQPYVQLIDKDGNRLFGNEGILLNATALSSSYTSLYYINVDKNNNLYVGLTATGEESKGYIHKVSPTGELLWGPSGIAINSDKAYDIKFFPGQNSELYVTYYSDGKGQIQKLNPETGATLWTNPIAVNGPNSNYPYTSIGEGAVLSDGSFVALIHARQTSDIYSYFYAQRYTAEGTPVWNSLVRLSNRNTMYNTRYNIIMEDDVIYLGYYGYAGSRFDSYLQRLNPNGTLPWGINGSEFSTENLYYEMNTSIAKVPGSSEIWAIARYTNGSQSKHGQYVQKYNTVNGDRIFEDYAKELYSVDSNFKAQAADLQIVDGTPIFLARNAENNGVQPTKLSLIALKQDGDFLFQNQYVDISATDKVKDRVGLTSFGSQVFAIWEENRTGATDGVRTYIQNYDIAEYLSAAQVKDHSKVTVYPNPVSEILYVSSEKEVRSVELYDTTGRKILNKTGKQINVQSLSKGVYLVKITLADGSVTNEKIIKK